MKPRFEILIRKLPEDHIPLLRAIRKIARVDLREAKGLLTYLQSNCPCVLLAGVEQHVADNVSRQLTKAGTAVQVQTSVLSHPMLVSPKLDDRYKDHWLFGLQPVEE